MGQGGTRRSPPAARSVYPSLEAPPGERKGPRANLQEGLHVQAAVADLPHHVVPAAGVGAAPATSCPMLGAGGDALAPLAAAGAPGVAGSGGAAVGLEVAQALAGGGLAVVASLVLAEGLLQTLLAHERAGPLAFGVAC